MPSAWPAVETSVSSARHGLCGDVAGGAQPHLIKQPVAATWTAGQVVDLEIIVTAHHNGYVEMRLCSDANQLSQDCLNANQLIRVARSDDVTPIDPAYPGRFYLDPPCDASRPLEADAYGYNYGNQLFGSGHAMRMSYQLPANLTCENCVMQMYYMTANSCNPPGYRTFDFPASSCVGDGGATGYWSPTLQDCGAAWGEEFWNCADLRIVASDGSTAETNLQTSANPTTTMVTTTSAPGGESSGCATPVSIDIIEEWQNGYLARITIANQSPASLSEWRVQMTTQSLQQVFEARIEQNTAGVVVRHPQCAPNIAAGNSASFVVLMSGEPTNLPTFVIVESGGGYAAPALAYTCAIGGGGEMSTTETDKVTTTTTKESATTSNIGETSTEGTNQATTTTMMTTTTMPTTTSMPTSSSCPSAVMTITQDWGTGYQATVAVALSNESTEFEIRFQLENGATLSGAAWGGEAVGGAESGEVAVTQPSWFAGGPVSIGFTGIGASGITTVFSISFRENGTWRSCQSQRAVLRRKLL